VVTPLYQFVKKLPKYTQETEHLEDEPKAILKALQTNKEPDELLFKALPMACNLPAIGTEEGDDGKTALSLRIKLVKALREIHTAYDRLLDDCRSLLYNGFAIRSEKTKLREDLRVRANHLKDKCIDSLLKRFTIAVTDEKPNDRHWLESVLMIIADKPVQSWTDEDVTKFELKLSDLVRRFKNLEAVQKEVVATGEGFEARRITVTHSDGQETHQMVYIDDLIKEKARAEAQKIISKLPDDFQLRKAILSELNEMILNSDFENVSTIQGKIKLQEPRDLREKSK
jgi:hypothetical protein